MRAVITVAASERSAMAESVEGRMYEWDDLEKMLHDAVGRLGPAHVAALVAYRKTCLAPLGCEPNG